MDDQAFVGQSERTFVDFWHDRVDAAPDAEFLVHGSQTLTYGEIDLGCDGAACALRDAGIRPGDLVALSLPTGLTMLRIQIAIQKLGAVMVPTIYGVTAAELGYVLGHCQPKALITDGASHDVLTGAGVPLPELTYVIDGVRSGALGAAELLVDATERPARPNIGPDSPMAIMYTSGSTGKPKGVVQPNRGIVGAGYAIAERLNASAEDTFFCCMPLFHAAATHMHLAPAIAVGGRLALESSFSRENFWSRVRDTHSTLAIMVPTQLAILMTAPPSPSDRDHSLRGIVTHVRREDFVQRFGVEVGVTWAMTETSGIGLMSRPGEPVPDKGVGRPMRGVQVKIVDADGRDASAGEPGELCYRHPAMMLEYYRDPANTADTRRGGWLRTGDLCDIAESGWVRFHGRLKNVIKRGGENIAGEEIELCLLEHPEVTDCVTSSVPDPIYTEEVHVVVSTEPGSTATGEELIAWCEGRLADWKVPRYLTVLDQPLPRLGNGKIDRVTVKNENDVAMACDFGSRSRTRSARTTTVPTR